MNADDLTAPILDREQIAALRGHGAHRLVDPEPAAPGPDAPAAREAGPVEADAADPLHAAWVALLVLGILVVLAMLATMVLWG